MAFLLSLTMRLMRLAAAILLLVWLGGDGPAVRAWDRLDALPDYDPAAAAEGLRDERRYSEALLVIEAGLASEPTGVQRAQLELLARQVEAERSDWLYRLSQAGEGALSGQGESPEALAGAVAADLFVFGDLRDLVIQGTRAVRGEDTDEVIVALSALGLVLTFTPTLDLGTAMLKFARRVGALSDAFARQLLRASREAFDQRAWTPVAGIVEDAGTLARRAGPAATSAILKNVNDADQLRLAARLSEKPAGAFTLWLGGKRALNLLEQGPDGEKLLLRAARKGSAGIDFAADHARLLLRPHPLVGLLKGLYKGNVPALLAGWSRSQASALLGLAAAWVVYELLRAALLIGRGVARSGLPRMNPSGQDIRRAAPGELGDPR